MIETLLDTDLYKLTMQQAVRACAMDGVAHYELIQRGRPVVLPPEGIDRVRKAIDRMASLRLKPEERAFLRETDLFSEDYLAWLERFRFDPDSEVAIGQDDAGRLAIHVEGDWERTILWETPILAIVSQVAHEISDTTPDMAGFRSRTLAKGERLAHLGVRFVDFGTRRRRSTDIHHTCLVALQQAAGARGFSGTSNLHFAHLLRLKPVGTIAHEWIMAHGARWNAAEADRRALANWLRVYPGEQTIALSDTYTLDHFLAQLDEPTAQVIFGIRHDSGDPLEFTDKVVRRFTELGIDPADKTLVFSDGLDVDAVGKIERHLAGRTGSSYGIGTHLTNDFPDARPFDIVMKLTRFDGKPAVKLTNEPEKAVGGSKAVEEARERIERAVDERASEAGASS